MEGVPYSVSVDRRRRIHTILAGVAIVTWYLAYEFLLPDLADLLGPPLHFLELFLPPWFIDPMDWAVDYWQLPGAFALYAFNLWVFDNWLWRLPHIRGWLRIPYLGGVWEGTRLRDSNDVSAQVPVRVEITQKWSRIRIETFNLRTTSHATSAAFLHDERKRNPELLFTYEMTGNGAVPKMLWGQGTQRFQIVDNERELRGNYYSTNTRSGSEVLRRQTRKSRGAAVTPQP